MLIRLFSGVSLLSFNTASQLFKGFTPLLGLASAKNHTDYFEEHSGLRAKSIVVHFKEGSITYQTLTGSFVKFIKKNPLNFKKLYNG